MSRRLSKPFIWYLKTQRKFCKFGPRLSMRSNWTRASMRREAMRRPRMASFENCSRQRLTSHLYLSQCLSIKAKRNWGILRGADGSCLRASISIGSFRNEIHAEYFLKERLAFFNHPFLQHQIIRQLQQ